MSLYEPKLLITCLIIEKTMAIRLVYSQLTLTVGRLKLMPVQGHLCFLMPVLQFMLQNQPGRISHLLWAQECICQIN